VFSGHGDAAGGIAGLTSAGVAPLD
jgi:hypothetical protein